MKQLKLSDLITEEEQRSIAYDLAQLSILRIYATAKLAIFLGCPTRELTSSS